MKLKFILPLLGVLCIILTILPFVPADVWWIRMFDFPHLQLTGVTLIVALLYLFQFDKKDIKGWFFWVILVCCFIVQGVKIYPYTPLAAYEVLNSTPGNIAPLFSVYTANVLQDNPHKEKLVVAIEEVNPEILLLMETDPIWKNAIANVTAKHYTYDIGLPLSNSYGMLLYSKFPLIDPEVKLLVEDSIPSIHSLVLLPSGDTIQLLCIHPSPPMPQHNPLSTDRDAEMMKTALKALQSPYPVLVLGDFNDVAWSETNQQFQEVSRLLDPRKGRGFYNTYHVEYFFFRWPLDHIFMSEEFRVTDVKREKSIDSDHFPISVQLTYEPNKAKEQLAPMPTKEQVKEAKDLIEKEEKEKE